ncbi:MAG: 3-deoxy-manno-octulosonate cytidylyltransferase [Candidatus Marinimicrobia bacterium]|nr:3-deoxy-manno-octulosonate cytidylyltransferase [Candidatus Neomarinimicrobiota bacterium]
MKIVGVIPARYGSSRLPGKPLKKIAGQTLIQRVYQNARKAEALDSILVATDDQAIKAEVGNFGGQAVLTSSEHTSGTDRIAEVIRDISCDYVVNIQGDEPFLKPSDIDRVVGDVIEKKCKIGTLAKKNISWEEYKDPNTVKVVINKKGFALYFSRHSIPYIRDQENSETKDIPALKHIGVYVFTREILQRFTKMAVSPLEKLEKLEQLRLLEEGYKIYITKTNHDSPGIDTAEDLKLAEGVINRDEFVKKN